MYTVELHGSCLWRPPPTQILVSRFAVGARVGRPPHLSQLFFSFFRVAFVFGKEEAKNYYNTVLHVLQRTTKKLLQLPLLLRTTSTLFLFIHT